MTPHRAAAVLFWLFSASTPAAAQDPAGAAALAAVLAPGDRVRVVTTTSSRPGVLVRTDNAVAVVGVVESVDTAALTVIAPGGNPVKVPIESIIAADLSVGRKRNWLNGLVGGLALGTAAGLTGPVDPQDCGPTSANFCSRAEVLAGSLVLLGAIGVGIGASIRTDQWVRRFTRPGAAAVSLGPSLGPGRIGFTLNVAF